MKEERDHPHLKFFTYKSDKIPVSIMSKEQYDELNSYEPMQYRPENWERFNNRQIKEFEWYETRVKESRIILQMGKISVLNHQDFLSQKGEIETMDGFLKWMD